MAKDSKRFVCTHKEGNTFGVQCMVLVDRETGVNYLLTQNGYGGGLTPLLDREGKPIVTSTFEFEE